jgi:hypothetical protein
VYLSRQSIDLDVTGSPLRADFDPDEVFDTSCTVGGETQLSRGPVYRGLEAAEARTLLSRLNRDPDRQEMEAWVLCSGTDSLQVVGSALANQLNIVKVSGEYFYFTV